MQVARFVSILACIALTMACGDQGSLSVGQGQSVDVTDVPADDTNNSADDGDDSSSVNNSTDSTNASSPDDAACTDGMSDCGGECVDTAQNDEHCGVCGNACVADTECASAECVCSDGGDLCDGACVDTSTSAQHCGDCGNACPGGQACVEGGCMSLTEVEGVLQATNQWRASGADCGQYGVKDPAPPLEADPHLNEAAQAHAVDMAENDFFSHTGSDGSSFSQRVARTDYSGFPVGENIAGGGLEPAGVVQRWVDSDGHCRNLMNPQATKLGVGFVPDGPYGSSWVQVFGR